MANKTWIYWILQFLGWGFVLSMGLLAQYLKKDYVEYSLVKQVLIFLVIAMATTHFYRWVIIKLNWLNQKINRAIPLMLIGSLGLAVILMSLNLVQDALLGEKIETEFKDIVLGIINFFIISLIWTIVYFGFHYFDKSRKQEVKNLQLQTSQKESELSNLKNQLNPHFMFNAMNSIRALVDENPVLAKKSITQLSNLLRNTLQTGKKREVTLQEEMSIVNDYLALEKIRFEERLNYVQNVPDEYLHNKVPPLIIQTLVENAIKHGIGNLAKGGDVIVNVSSQNHCLEVEVINDGKYIEKNTTESGIGLFNSRKRLEILYGDGASLNIGNENNKVVTKLVLPMRN